MCTTNCGVHEVTLAASWAMYRKDGESLWQRMGSGLVCDAGYFYETVSSRQAMISLSDLVNRVGATVFLRRERRVILGGVPNERCGRMWCFSFEELERIFGMCVPLTVLGDRVVRMDGLPIGGLFSKVAASVVLS